MLQGHEPLEAVVKGGFVCAVVGIQFTRADIRKVMAKLESPRH